MAAYSSSAGHDRKVPTPQRRCSHTNSVSQGRALRKREATIKMFLRSVGSLQMHGKGKTFPRRGKVLTRLSRIKESKKSLSPAGCVHIKPTLRSCAEPRPRWTSSLPTWQQLWTNCTKRRKEHSRCSVRGLSWHRTLCRRFHVSEAGAA